MDSSVVSIRQALARYGIELLPAEVEEVLQAAAHIASFLGGEVILDWGGNVGLKVKLDPIDDEEVFVKIVHWVEDDSDGEVWN